MNDKTKELLDRTFQFGVDVLRFLNSLPFSPVYKTVILQLSRSSISIGANYEEAQGAVSKRDFNYRIGISYKEARESEYWLRILASLYQDDNNKLEFQIYKMKQMNSVKYWRPLNWPQTNKYNSKTHFPFSISHFPSHVVR